MTTISPREFRATLRADFYPFMIRTFAELNPRAAFLSNWHIEVLAARLQAAQESKIKRLIICIPPRHLKSLAASIALPAWWLGRDPDAAIITVSYGQDLSDKFARDCRSIMQSRWYQEVFPTRLSGSRVQLQEFATTSGGSRMATSVGGVLTGRGADVLIIDDPLKPDEATTPNKLDSLARTAGQFKASKRKVRDAIRELLNEGKVVMHSRETERQIPRRLVVNSLDAIQIA